MENKEELMLVRITGADRPGLTADIMDILSVHGVHIQDIGQAVIHSTLSMGILIRVDEDKSGKVMKELLFKTSELGVNIKFAPVSMEEYEAWVSRQGKNRYIITMIGRKITAGHISRVTQAISDEGLNIDDINRLTGRMPLDEDERAPKTSIEFSVRGTLENKGHFQNALMQISNDGEVDISFQKDGIFRRSRRLICFDMDSTLIRTEVIDELADRAGVGEQVRDITERAMRGEIDFRESFKERVALLKGLDESVMEEIAVNLPITEGLDRMMTILKRVGYKTAILSGGFTYFGNYLKRRFGFDYVYANDLEIEDGKLTDIDFVELNACDGGCVGGISTVVHSVFSSLTQYAISIMLTLTGSNYLLIWLVFIIFGLVASVLYTLLYKPDKQTFPKLYMK